MAVKPEEIAALVELFQASAWEELRVEVDGLQLFLSRDPTARLGTTTQPASGRVEPAPAPAPALATSSAAPSSPETGAVPAGWVAVTAPNLGTFYRAPKPGAASLVEIGQSVTAETEICLLEVMKLFTAVKAGVAGTVRRICVADAEMVEFGQTLIYVEPA